MKIILPDERALDENEILFTKFSPELLKIRNALRKNISNLLGIDNNKPWLISGHQISFFHPGILIKDTSAASMALLNDGCAIHLALDIDPANIEFTYPCLNNSGKNLALKNSLFLGSTWFKEDSNSTDLAIFQDITNNLLQCLDTHLENSVLNNLTNSIQNIQSKLQANNNLTDAICQARIEDLQNLGCDVNLLFASEILKTNAWIFFTETISNRLTEFREIHNQVLDEYRKKHKIKNHAQPLPDLEDDELPFWLKQGTNREKAYVSRSNDAILLPRALTLTMFVRLFLADVFIHGLGGGRYDKITDELIRQFWKIEPPKYAVASATLSLPIKETSKFSILLNQPLLNELNYEIRRMTFNPQEYLANNDKRVIEFNNILQLFKKEKSNRQSLHKKLIDSKKTMLLSLQDRISEVKNKKNRCLLNRKNYQVINDRSYPYFFYDTTSLL